MNNNFPLFGQLSFDEPNINIDVHAAWEDIRAAYKAMNINYDGHVLPEVFARWSQLEDHLLRNGMQAVYAYYLQDFQHEINLTLLKSSEEFAVELMGILTELNLVNATMLLDFSKRNIDCLDLEKSALEGVLRSKQYLIETDRKKELGSLGELIIKYCEEPRYEFASMIFDEVLNHLRHQSTLYHFCITIPFNAYRKSAKGFYPGWLTENQSALIRKLDGFSSKAITESHVFYALKAGSKQLAHKLFRNIGTVNDYRKVAKLKDEFGVSLNESAWKSFQTFNPHQALAYVMCTPEEFQGADLAQPRYSEITVHKHVPEALAMLRRHKKVVDQDHVKNLIDNYSGDIKVDKLLQSLQDYPLQKDDFRITSAKLKRHSLESDLSL